jgi:hypothetical protein
VRTSVFDTEESDAHLVNLVEYLVEIFRTMTLPGRDCFAGWEQVGKWWHWAAPHNHRDTGTEQPTPVSFKPTQNQRVPTNKSFQITSINHSSNSKMSEPSSPYTVSITLQFTESDPEPEPETPETPRARVNRFFSPYKTLLEECFPPTSRYSIIPQLTPPSGIRKNLLGERSRSRLHLFHRI